MSFAPEEWQVRVDLAACYRLAAYYRMTDQIHTHISARVPDSDDHFLINPYGLLFEEITASSLIKIDRAGGILHDKTGLGINWTGFVIHGAIHEARPEVGCVMHTHTAAGVGVSAQKHGLLMISQQSLRFHDRVAYHDYEGIALDMAERERLLARLGDKNALVLRNHGLLTCGRRVQDAFDLMYFLERSCQAQIAALSAGREGIYVVDDETAEKTALQFERPNRPADEKHWVTLRRMLDRLDPSYKE